MITKESIERLKINREQIEQNKDSLNKLRESFEEDNKELIEKIKSLSDIRHIIEEDIRSNAIDNFKVTGEKKLLGGIGIRVKMIYDYDKEEAFKWAKEHQLCLSLDTKVFESIAKTQNIDFVKQEEKVTVTFPSKLILEEI